MPHLCSDVIPAAAQIVMALQSLVARETEATDSAVISVTNVAAGSGAFNVITGSALISGTVRTFKQSTRDTIRARMKAIVDGIAVASEIGAEFKYDVVTEVVLNNPQATEWCL